MDLMHAVSEAIDEAIRDGLDDEAVFARVRRTFGLGATTMPNVKMHRSKLREQDPDVRANHELTGGRRTSTEAIDPSSKELISRLLRLGLTNSMIVGAIRRECLIDTFDEHHVHDLRTRMRKKGEDIPTSNGARAAFSLPNGPDRAAPTAPEPPTTDDKIALGDLVETMAPTSTDEEILAEYRRRNGPGIGSHNSVRRRRSELRETDKSVPTSAEVLQGRKDSAPS